MKKYFLLLIALFLVYIPNSVFAITEEEFYGKYGDGNSNAYSNNVKESYANHIVHIEDLYFYDYFMDISGYAFIPYQDNYGGDGGNIKTYVVAFDGYSTWKEWSEKFILVDAENGTISCKNDKNCYLQEVEVESRDFWGSRCTVGCGNQEVITNYRLDERNGFNNTMTCSTEKVRVNGTEYDSECLYYNVGFSVSLNLNSVLDTLVRDSLYVGNAQETKIGFMIVTINTDVLIKKKAGVGIAYSQMYVPNKNCRYKNTNGSTSSCSYNNGIITDNFTLGYQSNLEQITLNARSVTPLIENGDGNFEVNGIGDDYYFYNVAFDSYFKKYNAINEKGFAYLFWGYVYDTTNYYSEMVEANRIVGGESGPPFMDKLYELATYNKNNCNDDGNLLEMEGVFGSNASCAVPNYKDGNNNYTHENKGYWVYSSWIKAQGAFVITGVKKNAVKVTCDVLGFDDSVQYIKNNVNGEHNNVNCNDDLMNDITIRQCSDFGDNGYEVSGEIYIDSSQVSSSTCGLNTMYDNGTKALIEITTKVLLNQTGYFRFNKISDSSFRAGKGFEIISKPNIEFVENSKNTLNYNALLEWSYFMWTKNNGIMKPHYSVSANYYDSNCSKLDAYELLNNANNFYYKNVSGVYEKSSLDDAIFNAIDLSVQSTYYDVATVNNISNNIDKNIEKFNENVKVVSYDSNSNKNVYNDVGGKWNLGKVFAGLRYILFDGSNVSFNQTNVSNSVKSGRGSFYSYYYSLPNAYISLVDNDNYNYSDVLYTDGEIDESKKKDFYYVGNKYFVPLKFSGSFPFNLAANVNPSLINVMEWELNGTCSVDVESGLFDDDGKPLYKYRSISLNTPFPKGNTSLNWREWPGNLDRLENTYDVNNDNISDENDYIYSFTLLKKYGNSGIEIAEVNSCSSSNMCSKSYGTFDGLGVDGISDFVEYYDQWANNQNSYCGLGFFSSRCDAFADGTILDIEGDLEVENGGLNEGVDTPIIIKPPGGENVVK